MFKIKCISGEENINELFLKSLKTDLKNLTNDYYDKVNEDEL